MMKSDNPEPEILTNEEMDGIMGLIGLEITRIIIEELFRFPGVVEAILKVIIKGETLSEDESKEVLLRYLVMRIGQECQRIILEAHPDLQNKKVN